MRIYFISRIQGRPGNAFPGKRFSTKRGALLYLKGRSCWDDANYKIMETKIPAFGNMKKPLIQTIFKDGDDVIEQAKMLEI